MFIQALFRAASRAHIGYRDQLDRCPKADVAGDRAGRLECAMSGRLIQRFDKDKCV